MSLLAFLEPVLNGIGFAGQAIINENTRQRQNRFNADEAQKNRDFQAQQAEIARDWQEQQYNQYSSPSAMVRQYRDAGLNPALMLNNSLQTSTGSSPSPSGSSASGSGLGSSLPSFSGIVRNLLDLKKIDAEIDNMRADSDAKRAQAILSGSYTDVNKTVQDLNKKQLDRIDQEIYNMKEQAKTEVEKRNTMVIDQAFKIASTKQVEFSNAMAQAFKKVTGVDADAHTISMLVLSASNIIGNVVGNGFGILQRLFNSPRQKSLKIPKVSEVTGNVQ